MSSFTQYIIVFICIMFTICAPYITGTMVG